MTNDGSEVRMSVKEYVELVASYERKITNAELLGRDKAVSVALTAVRGKESRGQWIVMAVLTIVGLAAGIAIEALRH